MYLSSYIITSLNITSVSHEIVKEQGAHLLREQRGQSPACLPGHLCLLLHSGTCCDLVAQPSNKKHNTV